MAYRRRRRARPNPAGATWLLIAGSVAAVGVVGYLIYNAVTPVPPALPPPSATVVTLAPGTVPDVSFSLAAGGALQLEAPTGGTITGATFNPTTVLATPAAGAPAAWEYAALTVGTTAVSATYTDSTGATQTSTFNVTVTT